MAETFFCKATWADVKAGDVVLMPWTLLDQVAEAEIVEVWEGKFEVDGRPAVFASLHIDDMRFARWAFEPEAVAYVRSRL
jgi:hypothetical protein